MNMYIRLGKCIPCWRQFCLWQWCMFVKLLQYHTLMCFHPVKRRRDPSVENSAQLTRLAGPSRAVGSSSHSLPSETLKKKKKHSMILKSHSANYIMFYIILLRI